MRHEVIGLGEPPREGLRDRVLALRAQSTFEKLDDEGLILLAEHARTRVYEKGETVTERGQPSRAIFVILEGDVALDRPSGEGIMKPGQAFGALPVLAGVPSVRSTARTRARVLEVPAAAFETALEENYSLLRGILGALGAMVLEVQKNLPINTRAGSAGQQPRVVEDGEYSDEPCTLAEHLLRLRKSPFGDMNLDALVDLARNMDEVRYEADTLIWRAGDPSTHSLHLGYGRVRCTSAEGGTVEVGRSFTLGMLDLWGSRHRAYEARTVTRVIAYRIDFEAFLTVIESHVELGVYILRSFARALLAAREIASE